MTILNLTDQKTAETDIKPKIASLQAELEKRKEELTGELESIKTEQAKASLKIEELNLDIKKREEEITKLTKQLEVEGLTAEEKSGLIGQLETKVTDLEKKIADSNRKISELVIINHNLQRTIEELRAGATAEADGDTEPVETPVEEVVVNELPESYSHIEGTLFPFKSDWIVEFPEPIMIPVRTTLYVYRGAKYVGKVEAADVTRTDFHLIADFLDDGKADEQSVRLVPLDRDCLDHAGEGSREDEFVVTAV